MQEENTARLNQLQQEYQELQELFEERPSRS